MKRRIAVLAAAVLVTTGFAGIANAAHPVANFENRDNNTDNDVIMLAPAVECGTIVAATDRDRDGDDDVFVIGSGGEVIGAVHEDDGDVTDAEFGVDSTGLRVDLDGDGDHDFDCESDIDIMTGYTCGFHSTDDPSGQVIQDPNTQAGEVTAGPWAVVVAESVTMTCTISVGDGVVSPDDTVVSLTNPGWVGSLASLVTYHLAPGVAVWLCTHVSWTYSGGGSGSWSGFTGDADGNPHCDEAIGTDRRALIHGRAY